MVDGGRHRAGRCIFGWALIGGGLFFAPLAMAQLQRPLRNIVQVTTGSSHGCALSIAGEVLCWGENRQGQLGNGTTQSQTSATPVLRLRDARAITAGYSFTCALVNSGSVSCWGHGYEGQLGNGQRAFISPTPIPVIGMDRDIAEIAAGVQHTCALDRAGDVKCWGDNHLAQLGDGTREPLRFAPVPVVGLDGPAIAISAGQWHSCAAMSAGGVRCWGYYGFESFFENRPLVPPTPVDGLNARIVSLASGFYGSCGLSDVGGVWCWGNLRGHSGDGSTERRLYALQPTGLGRDVVSIASNRSSSTMFALTLSGVVYQWGLLPTAVVNLPAGIQAISEAARCAVSAEGGVVCRNGETQLATEIVRVIPQEALQVTALASSADADSVAADSDASGRYVVFQSRASNLVGGDSNGSADVFVLDTQTGAIQRISLDPGGAPFTGDAIEPSLSADGQLVVFVAPDGVVASTPQGSGAYAVYLRNRATATTLRLGAARTGGIDTSPQLAADGTRVVYAAANVDADVGAVGQVDIYTVALQRSGNTVQAGAAECVSCKSRSANGAAVVDANGASGHADVSANGRYLVYETLGKMHWRMHPRPVQAPRPRSSCSTALATHASESRHRWV